MTSVAESRKSRLSTETTAERMKPFQRSGGAVFRINGSLLTATIFASLSWWSWPGNARWWAFGLISVAFAIAAAAVLGQAIRLMGKLYRRDRALAAYLDQGQAPKSAKLASDDALRKAGMIP